MISEEIIVVKNSVGRELFTTLTPAAGNNVADLVIFIHGFKGFRNWCFFPLSARTASEAGFHALRMDFSLNVMRGTSDKVISLEDFADNTLTREADDVADIVKAIAADEAFAPLREKCTGVIHVVGHSRGGGIAHVAAREMMGSDVILGNVVVWNSIGKWGRWTDRQRDVWLDQGYVEIENSRTGQTLKMNKTYLLDNEAHEDRLSLVRSSAQLGERLLYIHAEMDLTVNIAEIRRLQAAANTSADLVTIDGSTHTFGMVHNNENVTGSFTKVLDHTIRHLKQ